MKELDDSSFRDFVENNKVAVIDFYADWCGPCQMLKPVMEEVSKELEGKAGIAKLDIDKSRETAQEYGVMSIPTVLIFREGKLVDLFSGAVPKSMVIEKINKFL